jgi:septum site-determining protein MinC
MSTAITVKGIRKGVLITLGAGEIADLLGELEALIDSRITFFAGGRVALQVGERMLNLDQVTHLRQLFEDRAITVEAILSIDPTTCAAVEQLGLKTKLDPRSRSSTRLSLERVPAGPLEPQAGAGEPPEEDDQEMGILVDRTLRSGQTVHCVGHVVVLGDVNPGAEVMAGGDVIVWGRLRGIVHAGALGDEGRCVCALDLSPTQLRIGSHIARPPEEKHKSKQAQPERAFISRGQIVAERWR